MKNKITVKLEGKKVTLRPFGDFLKEQYPTKKLRVKADARFQRFSFGYEVFLARKKKHLTQAKLAKKLGTTQSEVARIESGDQNVTFDKIKEIAKALNQPFLIKP
ncbi:MAG: helix-turn-helix transcriptional regulator [bacterium]|nr:helix-turn-helix transcriptional regulator [bacterium]